ncbi:MAG: type I-D CRISPR-associated helicase Cas3' [Halothece sp.]
MQIYLKPLYSQLNAGVGSCPLGCQSVCQVYQTASSFVPPEDCSCPLSLHQVETYAEVTSGNADIIFNTAATGDGKSLAAYLPALLNSSFRVMGLYPTIELVEDQYRHLESSYEKFEIQQRFEFSITDWCDRLYGRELTRKVKEAGKSNKFQEILFLLEHTPLLVSNPDIFHLITHFRYLDVAYDPYALVDALARYIDLWVFDEFHIFGPHQEAAVLNSLLLICATQQRKRRFLFTSATPKSEFLDTLQKAGFHPKIIGGKDYYRNSKSEGFRPILQPVELNFIHLEDANTISWFTESISLIRQSLEKERQGRGLIIVNSVAFAGRLVHHLKELLEPEIRVEEISGRISKHQREQTYQALKHETKPVLVVGTSAVDVGVDFKINLLIFESSDCATIIQRLGRLGRHPDFNQYNAFILIPKRMPWIEFRLKEAFEEGNEYSRHEFQEKIEDCFNSRKDFWEYRSWWGTLQAQGMLHQMERGNKERSSVMQPVKERMKESLKKVYPTLERVNWYWTIQEKDPVRSKIKEQLLSFRGSSDLQAAVWDTSKGKPNFYSYDLLRLLPYTLVEVIDRETFLEQAQAAGYLQEEFPEEYFQVYLKLNANSELDQRQPVELRCKKGSEQLKTCTLSILDRISLTNHPQAAEVSQALNRKKLLAFLVPINQDANSYWRLREMLYLSPTFGLYRLTDLDREAYACAFNQDALLLDALSQRGKFKKYCQERTKSSFF